MQVAYREVVRARVLAPVMVLVLAGAGMGSALAQDIEGTPHDDVLSGTAEDDRIDGLGGADLLRGKGGSDWLLGGRGSDDLYGGAGWDRLWGGAVDQTDSDVDRLFGGFGRDSLVAIGGRDRLYGGGQRDELFAWATGVVANGGYGGDYLEATVTETTTGIGSKLRGAAGSDTLVTGVDSVSMWGGRGDDHLSAFEGLTGVRLNGGPGDDQLDSNFSVEEIAGSNRVTCGPGHDEVEVGEHDTVAADCEDVSRFFWGTAAADNFTGSKINDWVWLYEGDDVAVTGSGDDDIRLGSGRDRVNAGTGDDSIKADDASPGGPADLDSVTCGPGFDEVFASPGDSIAEDCEQVSGLEVPSTANLWAFGHGSAIDGTPPIRVGVSGARRVTFPAVQGQVACIDGYAPCTAGPDGSRSIIGDGDTEYLPIGGLSGLIDRSRQGPTNYYLVGVFVRPGTAAADPPPPLDFSNRHDFKRLSPTLGQTFFVGDGHASGGELQTFEVPNGARWLVLGVADQCGSPAESGCYFDNSGAFKVALIVDPT